jgi:Flp pilus assembly protein TadD
MLQRFLFLVLLNGSISLYSQSMDQTLIKEGVELHDQGKYTEAIAKYNEVLLLDKQNLHALAEKAYTQMGLQDYQSAISTCKKALKIKSKDEEALKLVYTTYGNALDLSGKARNALKVYDKGLKEYPGFYSLHYNKGITLSGLGDWEGATKAFEQSAMARPDHSSSYLALGRMLEKKNENIPALLSYLRFHVIEPDSPRSRENFEFVQELVFSNVEKNEDNSISISLPSISLEEMGNDEEITNSFRSIELILSMQSALDLGENQEGMTEVERFQKKLKSVFTIMDESKSGNSGFYWEFLAPYFIELNKMDYDLVLANLVFSQQKDERVNIWVEENEEKIRNFYEWSSNYEW